MKRKDAIEVSTTTDQLIRIAINYDTGTLCWADVDPKVAEEIAAHLTAQARTARRKRKGK